MAQITFTNTGGITAQDTIKAKVFNEDGTNLASKYAAIGHNHDSSYVAQTSIADNLTTNDATKVLSAKQGKALQDNKVPYYSVDSSKWDTTPTSSSNKPVTSNGIYQITSDLQTRMADVETKVGKNIGELVFSSVPLVDSTLHLADGSYITRTVYADFYDYIVSLYPSNTVIAYSDWTTEKTANGGAIGKYGYDSTNSRVYLPDFTNTFLEGTNTASELGTYVAPGIPNIRGDISIWLAKLSGSQYSAYTGSSSGGALYRRATNEPIFNSGVLANNTTTTGNGGVAFNAAIGEYHSDSVYRNNVYGKADTVQPPAVKQYIYIVVANAIRPDYVVDVDELATEINALKTVSYEDITSQVSLNTSSFSNLTVKAYKVGRVCMLYIVAKQLYGPSTSTYTIFNNCPSKYLPIDEVTFAISYYYSSALIARATLGKNGYLNMRETNFQANSTFEVTITYITAN